MIWNRGFTLQIRLWVDSNYYFSGMDPALVAPVLPSIHKGSARARDVRRPRRTLGRIIGMRDNFHLNFFCKWLCVLTRSETAVTKILFDGFMFTTNATDLAKKMLWGRHFMGLNSLNFILCSWCYLVRHLWEDPVCLIGPPTDRPRPLHPFNVRSPAPSLRQTIK